MSARNSLSLAYGSREISRETSAFIQLEQKPFDPYAGYLTRMGVVGYLNAKLFDAPAVQEYCPSEDGSFALTVYAYPSPAGLNYRFGCAHGLIGQRIVTTELFTEAVQCDLEAELQLKYPALSIVGYEWIGDAYDAEGAIVPRPAIAVTGVTMTTAVKVYGTVLVTYQVVQHAYSVAVSARAGAVENKVQAFAYACWDGGNKVIELEAPPGAEEGICQNSGATGSAHIDDDDTPDPGNVTGSDETIHINYCTGERE